MKFRKTFTYRLFSAGLSVLLSLSFSIVANAQNVFTQNTVDGLDLPATGTMITLSVPYHPVIVKGITLYPDNPLKFDFIIEPGDDNLQGDTFQDEANKLIKYFMASLTVPEDKMWVNLSPYEKDRIIADGLSQTELGRDMLAQDYILKQLTASMTYPKKQLGKKFWKQVYAKTQECYGTTEIPMDTFNKVWIVPDKANVYVRGNSIFVVDRHLKVMLEEDYLALESNMGRDSHGVGKIPENQAPNDVHALASEVVKNVLLPAIEREVNEGKNFANLRQIFNSMILATWYKQNLKNSLLGQIYANQNKIKGIDLEDKEVKTKIYSLYVEAFKTGVFDCITEDYDETIQSIVPRKYFSGGIKGPQKVDDSAMISETILVFLKGSIRKLTVNFRPKLPIPQKPFTHKNYSGRYEIFIKWLLQNPYLPIDSLPQGSSIVDLGSSYGYATIDMANQLLAVNPNIHVFGVDSFKDVGKQGDSINLPKNLTFVRDDNRLLNRKIPPKGIKIFTSFNVWQYYDETNSRLGVSQMGKKLNEGDLLIIGDGGKNSMSFVVMQKDQNGLMPKELVLSQSSSPIYNDFSLWAYYPWTNYIPDPLGQIIQNQFAEITNEWADVVSRARGKIESEEMVLSNQLKVLDAHGVNYKNSINNTITIPLEQFYKTESNDRLSDKKVLSDTRNPGGIDFNSDNLDLNTQGDQSQIKFIAHETLDNVEIEGFVPVVINVSPLTDMSVFLE